MKVHAPTLKSHLRQYVIIYLLVASRKVAEIMMLPSQLKAVASAMARPLLDAGNISLRMTHVMGPKPKE